VVRSDHSNTYVLLSESVHYQNTVIIVATHSLVNDTTLARNLLKQSTSSLLTV
jgi:hypothetical protein